jgi:hypothetical protein
VVSTEIKAGVRYRRRERPRNGRDAVARTHTNSKVYVMPFMWAKLNTLLDRPMKLDTILLGNAVRRLREGLARYEREPTDEQIRDGIIQRFELT